MKSIPQTFPTEPGCYIDGSHGHYAASELLCRFGNIEEQHIGAAYQFDPDSIDGELVCDAADAVIDRWNDSLPDTLVADWEDGEFYVSEITFDTSWLS